MRLSPYQGLLHRDKSAIEPETLVRARDLAQFIFGTASVCQSVKTVSYIQVMFASHQIILADGVWSESFYPDIAVLTALNPRDRDQFAPFRSAHFPEIARNAYGPRARQCVNFSAHADDRQTCVRVAG